VNDELRMVCKGKTVTYLKITASSLPEWTDKKKQELQLGYPAFELNFEPRTY
jgi:hypothetical protein